MSHRSTTLVAALGLSAVLLGASPATAGTAHRIDPETSTARTDTPTIVSARMAERGYSVRRAATGSDTDEKQVVSARMAERGHSVRSDPLERKIWAYDDDGTKRGVARHNLPIGW